MNRTLLSLALAATLEAQPRPGISARRILTETEDNYCSCNLKSLEVEADVTVENTSDYVNSSKMSKVITSWLAPSKIRVERRDRSGSWEINLNNGVEEAQLFSDNPPYRRPVPKIWRERLAPDEFPGTHFLLYDSLTADPDSVRLKGEETLTMGGARIPCYVIEVSRNLRYRSGTITGTSTLWIGKQRRWVYKEVSSRDPIPGEPRGIELPSAMRRTVILTKIRETPPPPATAFDIDAILRTVPRFTSPPSISVSAVAPAPLQSVDKNARTLLAETSVNYLSLNTYRGEHTAVYDMGQQGARQRIRIPIRVSYRRPGQWRLFWEHEGSLWVQDAAKPDGFYEYWPKHNSWWRNEFTQFLRPPEMLYEDAADNLLAARMLPNERIESGGETVECAVVEARYSQEAQLLLPAVRYASPEHVTYWIDPKRKLVLQWHSGGYTETVIKLEINPPLPDSEFQFTPPPGARVHRPY